MGTKRNRSRTSSQRRMAKRGQGEVLTWFQAEVWRSAFHLGSDNQVKFVLRHCVERLRKLHVDTTDLKYEADTAVQAAMLPPRRRCPSLDRRKPTGPHAPPA
jgi:hypothetical protein